VEKFMRQREDPGKEASRIDTSLLARHGFTRSME